MRLLPVLLCAGTLAAQVQPRTAYDRGRAAFEAHQYAEAAALFAEAEKSQPGLSDALLFEGKSLASAGRFAEADGLLRRYAAAHPDSAGAFYMLGFVLNREGRPGDSLQVYTQAARLSTPQSDDLKIVATDYVLLNDYPDAIRWLEKVVAFDPKNENAWYALGRCDYTQSRFIDAEQAFRRALALDGRDLKAQVNLGLVLEMENRGAEADAAYRKGIALADADPHTDEWPYLDYGAFLLDRARAAEAIPLLRRAVAAAPRCADCHAKLGQALAASGDARAGIAELKQAVALSPADPKLHYEMGRVYRAAGMKDDAKQELDLSAKLYGARDSVGPQ